MTTNKTTNALLVPNYFTKLDMVDVTKYIEKKGRFSYLSWAYAFILNLSHVSDFIFN